MSIEVSNSDDIAVKTKKPVFEIDDPRTGQKLCLFEGDILRTQKGCRVVATSPAWGHILGETEDPEILTLPPEVLDALRLRENFPKVPAELWSTIIDFYRFMMNPKRNPLQSCTEVAVVFLRGQEDDTKWRVVVPTQEVSGASCRIDYGKAATDLLTGEDLPEIAANGWHMAGTSHSHHRMGAFFSSTDDASELTQPGLHIVVGEFRQELQNGQNLTIYAPRASVVLRKTRHAVLCNDVVDLTWKPGGGFHRNVLKRVQQATGKTVSEFDSYYPKTTPYYGGYSGYEGWNSYSGNQRHESWTLAKHVIGGNLTTLMNESEKLALSKVMRDLSFLLEFVRQMNHSTALRDLKAVLADYGFVPGPPYR